MKKVKQEKTPQQIFIHIRAVFSEFNKCKCESAGPVPELDIHLYKSKTAAQRAYDYAGGFLIETTSDKLKGYIDETVCVTDRIHEFFEGDPQRFVTIFSEGLPHKMVAHVINEGDENEYTTEFMRFSKKSVQWIDEFEEATGTRVTQ